MFEKLFEKKKYLDCPLMKNSLHFYYDEIRACCTNIPGPMFYEKFKGGDIDWDYIYEERKKYFDRVKKAKEKNFIPDECVGCCDAPHFITEKKPEDFKNEITKVYFHNHMSCNARCTYCTYERHDHSYGYDVFQYVKEIIDKKILSPCAHIYMSGGEITVSKEFEDLLSLLLSYVLSQIEILTNGIKYCTSIEQAFIQNRCRLMISLDCGTREIFEKIKQTDSFDKVIDNIRRYIQASENAKELITLKYIIVDNVNDTVEEIEKFLSLVKELDVKHVRLDFDYLKYKFERENSIPKNYFTLYEYFNKSANDKNLHVEKCDQIEAILDKNR